MIVICNQCGVFMVNVGREIKPGHPEVWMDGWVCASGGCQGYATTCHDGTSVQWPALTLMDAHIHSNIRGALKFKKSVIR